MAKKSNRSDYTAMLEEAERYYGTQVRSLDILRDHAKTILGAASVLVTLFATFSSINASPLRSIYHVLIAVAIVFLYAWLMVKSLVAASPGLFHHPIVPEMEEYKKAFLNKNDAEITLQRLSNYINVIPRNDMIIQERRKLGQLITVQLAIIVVLILISSLVQF